MTATLKLSSILSGLSYALDLTEGHPRGHASRSCLIGMRIAAALGLDETVAAAEPEGREIAADSRRLDDLSAAFAWVIDAKSPYTYHHSERVADFSVAIGRMLGLADAEVVRLRRAALLHDIGKLSVPNRILDKPDTLTPGEWEVVKLHPYYTFQILERVPVFGELAFDASAHHERLRPRLLPQSDGRAVVENRTDSRHRRPVGRPVSRSSLSRETSPRTGDTDSS